MTDEQEQGGGKRPRGRESPRGASIFARSRVRAARARSAGDLRAFDFLHRRAMADIADRLASVTRSFERALVYGWSPRAGELGGAVASVALADCAAARLAGDASGSAARLVFDEELSPVAPQSFDLIVSLLTLHAANDVIGALAQARMALKPDGLFLAALFGEQTLKELREAFCAAELELCGGAALRFAPFAGVRDLGQALQRAGFALPVADVDHVEVRYGDPARLLRDLTGMGERGVLAARERPLSRAVLARALDLFAGSGGVATFDLVYLTGWAPHPGQPKALRPGSGRRSLADAVRNFR